ncbi:MAG: BsuPI-related putative proteinase inhibitor [Gemmatimonadaceae bacterium]|nr:BsuPI-related putative proteinase inhibitor [Gemmatimonadaceae bacterium]
MPPIHRLLLAAALVGCATGDRPVAPTSEPLSPDAAAAILRGLADSAAVAGDASGSSAYVDAAGVVASGVAPAEVTVTDNGVASSYRVVARRGPTTSVIAWSAQRPMRLVMLHFPSDSAAFGAASASRGMFTVEPTPAASATSVAARLPALVHLALSGSAALTGSDTGVACGTAAAGTTALPPGVTSCRVTQQRLALNATFVPMGPPSGASALARTLVIAGTTVPVTAYTVDTTRPPVPPTPSPTPTPRPPVPPSPPVPPTPSPVPPPMPVVPLVARLTVPFVSADSVVFALTWSNTSRDTVRLGFGSSQRFDLEAVGVAGRLWQWSATRAFAAMLSNEVIPPGGSLSYVATWPRPTRGPAVVRAWSVNTSGPRAAASVPVTIP